ncbi:MFS transporter [Virgisporangium ochraceum]|uniref:MFS transporter n=1 Tax=Virgisporangium ochraceum TaxID=65505 RepID=A0A8J4A6H8_9ACTN|nr:MFS transporter [Virgisporangium ochraceum]GIJ74760.1 MFS transporter [Virgisporangium ochraceum]
MAAPRLALYTGAAVTVRMADEGARIALILLAFDRIGAGGPTGLLVACLMVPHVVAAPVVGAMTDRSRRPPVLIGVLALGFGAALAVTAGTLGRLPLAVPVLVLLAGGACGPALTGALSSQVARLTSAERLPRAFGVDGLTYNVAGIVGPALAGVVGGAVGPAAACLLMAGLAAAGGTLAATLPGRGAPVETLRGRGAPTATPPGRGAPTATVHGRGPRPGYGAGIRAIVADRTLLIVVVASTVGQLGPGAVPVVVAFAAEAAGDAAAAGLMLAAVAAGGLVGSLLWTARPAPAARAPSVLMVAMCGAGLPLLVGAFTTALPVLAGALVVSGLFSGPLIGALFTARSVLSPEGVRAQVFTIAAGLKVTAAATGTAVVGLLADWPLPVLFLLVGLNPVVTGAVGLLALRVSPRGP